MTQPARRARRAPARRSARRPAPRDPRAPASGPRRRTPSQHRGTRAQLEQDDGGEHERAAGELERPERLAEHDPGERDRHSGLDRRGDRGGGGADAREAGHEHHDRDDGREQRDHRRPHDALAARVHAAGEQRGDREGHRRAGGDARGERDGGDLGRRALGAEDEDGVEAGARERHGGAERVDRTGAAAGEHEDDAARGERERAELAAGRRLAAQREGGEGDERGVGVEQQRREPDVDALDRAEVEAGLQGVAAEAERGAEGEAARRAQRAAAQQHERPQHGRGHDEAEGEQRGQLDARGVGLAGEDRHRGEAGGRQQTQQEPLALAVHTTKRERLRR